MQHHSPQQSPALFVPATEGIKYAGSKLKLIPHILPLVCGLRGVETVLDGFSGSTRVSQALYQTGRYTVVSNDVSAWSQVFARCYLQASRPAPYYEGFIARLNALPGREGWFTEHYGGEAAAPVDAAPDDVLTTRDADAPASVTKHPFQRKNTMRLDAIRDEIASWRASGEIDATTESVLLTSLILGLDCVDSTLGHFSSYLKRWSKRSYRDLTLRLPRLCFSPDCPAAHVTRSDIFDLLRPSVPVLTPSVSVPAGHHPLLGDPDRALAYFDPPYGSNNTKMPPSRVRYASYYHFWTSVVLNDRPPLFGKAARREDSRDGCAASVFEDFRSTPDGRHVAMAAIERLIDETPARYVLLSYSSSGRASRDELLDIIHSRARLRQTLTLDHANHVMARMQWTRQWLNADAEHKEYLFLLEK